MADRCHDRSFLTDADYDRSSNPYVRRESDWLAERIGQTDSFGTPAKTPLTLPSGGNVLPQYAPAEEEASAPAGWPPRMQRARQEAPPQQEFEQPEPQYQPSPLRPSRCRPVGLPAAASEQDHHDQDANEQPVNDALYCSIKTVEHTRDPAYPMVTVAAVLALAVVGTGAALTYRTYVGSERSGETPIVRADISQTKVMPVQSDGGVSKIPDRMPPSDGGEKLVSREEAPVDSNSNSGLSRAVFPPLNQSSSPPPVASVSSTALATTANGTMPNNEPRKIKTVKSDAENGGIPAGAAAPAKPDPAARSASTPTAPAQRKPSAANASANAPLTLSPQSAPASDPAPPIRLAATNTVQAASSAGGGYLVQVSSQKNEADVQASYRALQSKFPAALGSRPPVIKRADLGDKGVYYRTMVGPFGSSEEAAHFCGNLKSSGGQCVIQKMAKTTE
jgi:hypothetical protein